MKTRRSSIEEQPAPARVAVRDIMTTNVIAVSPETSIPRVAELMDQHAISGLPVVDPTRRVVGMVTDHDLIIRNTRIAAPAFLPVLEGRIPLESPGHFKRRVLRVIGSSVGEVMSVDVKTISPDEDLETLAERMIKERMKILPVVEGGRLAGVVTRADVIRWMVAGDPAGKGILTSR